MSSILTNTGAMVALQTMRGINANMERTQSEISTGLRVGSAKDNAASWAISKTMESDVRGFQAIRESLTLGKSSVAVAAQASETVTDLLTQMKGRIVAAQEDNVDRGKIQGDIASLRDQIASVVGAAQFNGLNMVSGTERVNILSSLDRDSAGQVSAAHISVSRQDLTTSAGVFNDAGTNIFTGNTISDTGAGALANTGNSAQIDFNAGAYNDATTASISVNGIQIDFAGNTAAGLDQDDAAAFFAGQINALGLDGITASVANGNELTITSTRAFAGVDVAVSGLAGNAAGTQITDLNGAAVTVASGTISERAENITFSTVNAVNEGDGFRVSFGGETFTYVAGPGQSMEDVARGLKAAVDGTGMDGITTQVTQDSSGAWQLKIDNDSASAMTLAAVANAGGTASGGLFGLDGIDVSTDTGARAALDNIEQMINRAISSSAAFGSIQGRLDTQSEFVNNLTDSLRAGIGSLVDADMTEASARLQALQVQQQLGVQALSIANQQPQLLLSLFR